MTTPVAVAHLAPPIPVSASRHVPKAEMQIRLTSARRFCRILLVQAALAGMCTSPLFSQAPGPVDNSVRTSLSVCSAERRIPSALPPPTCLAAPQPGQLGHNFDKVSEVPTSRRRIGTAIGAVVGASAAYFILNSGGSTSLCDKSANQDATSTGTCVGLYMFGGLAGAGLGFVIVGLVTTNSNQQDPTGSLQIGVRFGL